MNRIEALFSKKKNNVLNIYCTAGFPNLASTNIILQALQNNGADIIEIGMPYSDPLADGEVIQASSHIALQNGMRIDILFEQLKNVRNEIKVPLILMGYMNPVMQYGIEKFCATAAEVGIDGIILPDLPLYEFEQEYKKMFEKYQLSFTFLVTPETSEERIKKIDSLSTGFIYAVSSSATTGNSKPIEAQQGYFKKLQQMNLINPILVGFGIHNKQTFNAACTHTNGAIIGSAYIKALQNNNDINIATSYFLKNIIG
jgi:tryptophan synthase alpha chain